jgi:hypothetical protein
MPDKDWRDKPTPMSRGVLEQELRLRIPDPELRRWVLLLADAYGAYLIDRYARAQPGKLA